MTISFFITENDEFYASMEATSLNDEIYSWLSEKRIDLGRESSFPVAKRSPSFSTLVEAEAWLKANWFSNGELTTDFSDIDPETGPTEEHYKECARIAHEINEYTACAKLEELLELEKDHSYLCQFGVWYWSIGHKKLAVMSYKRSIDLHPEAATYFNLAVCLDDLEKLDEAKKAITSFYELVSSDGEKKQVENMLRQNGKAHLIPT